jgi:opacity protein-like surface antigen
LQAETNRNAPETLFRGRSAIVSLDKRTSEKPIREEEKTMIKDNTLFGTITTLVSVVVLAGTARADEAEKFYASASIGAGTLSSATLTFSDGVNTSTAGGRYDASFAGGGALGYRFDNGWTLEGELMYRRNELDPVSLAGLGDFNGGDFASLGFAVSALYRFDIGSSGKLRGYAGPGLVYLQEIDIDFDNGGEQEISFETDDTAWQLKVGGRYDFSERWFVDAAATYLAASSVRMKLPADTSQTIESDYDHLTLSLGVGWRF